MASGDKFYLADKETLDEVDEKIGSTKDTGGSSTAGSVFGKINYLVSQVSSYLATIYSWINTLMGKIGNTNDSEGTATTGTVMGKLNFLVTRMGSVYSWANNIFSRVGTTTDTGGTTTAGTVMAKENAILAEVNKIGASDDVGGAEGVGSIHAKENTLLRQTKQIIDHLKGEYLSNFGDGRMGSFVYGTTSDSPMTDEYKRRVYYTENFTIPSGKVMKVTSRNNGVIIFARGNITIDGSLDISEMRDTSADPTALPSSVKIAGTNFVFATGGSNGSFNSASRPCGTTGGITGKDKNQMNITADPCIDHGGTANQGNKAGSVSGGAPSLVKYNPFGARLTYSSSINKWELNGDDGDAYTSFTGHVGAGAVMLICSGTIKITGSIKASGAVATFNPNGSAPWDGDGNNSKYTGSGGSVLAYQGGGGAVTMIAKTISNTGTINVSGNASRAVSAGTDNQSTISVTLNAPLFRTTTHGNYESGDPINLTLTGGKGAAGYTCQASSSGNIKQYILS